MGNWWLHDLYQDGRLVELVSQIFWVILSITLHELGHGWAALYEGDDTPRASGHMTANPVVHMGVPSLIMFALTGIAWGQMPVNPTRFRRHGRRLGDVIVSAAGPAMNLLIALVCLIVLVLWLKLGEPAGDTLFRNVATFLFYGIGLNLILAPFNLLPIPPLDGSRILAGFSRGAERLFDHPNAAMIGLMAFLLIFVMTPMGDLVFSGIWTVAANIVNSAGTPLGNPDVVEVMYGDVWQQVLASPELRTVDPAAN
jgi:Zn-dependent protease